MAGRLRTSQRHFLTQGLTVHGSAESLLIEDSPSPPRTGLTVRLRTRKQPLSRLSSDQHSSPLPALPETAQSFPHATPVLKPKKAKRAVRSSSALRSPGVQLDTPAPKRKKTGLRMLRFPTVLMLRLVKAKARPKRAKDEQPHSPKLNLVTLECPQAVVAAGRGASGWRTKTRGSQRDVDRRPTARHVPSLSLDAQLQSYSSLREERCSKRPLPQSSDYKTFFVKRESPEDQSDPDYDGVLDSYYL